MGDQFKPGDRMQWRSHGPVAVGKVKRKITSGTRAAGRTPCVRGRAAVTARTGG